MAAADFDLVAELGEIYRKAAAAPRASDLRALAREIEEMVALLNFQLTRIDRNRELWSKAVADGVIEFQWEMSRDLSRLYSSWLENAEATAGMARKEIFAGQLQCGEEFWENLRRVQLMSLDTDRTKRSIESLQNGTGVPFERAMESLRSNLR